MKNKISLISTIVISLSLIIMGLICGFNFTPLQKETLKTLIIICGCSIIYCFFVGEISRNNSQMDKLWSVLPIVYAFVVMIKGGFKIRLIFATIVITIWGVRLTYNFAKKGAYKLKFWEGEEDYRWKYLRSLKMFNNKIVWGIFDLLFISFFQNIVVLFITLPCVAMMEINTPIGFFDILSFFLSLFFVFYEIIADKQQNAFQVKKYEYLNSGKKLDELPDPYNKGFCVSGLWKHSRHPNYLGEQGIWVSLYLMAISAGIAQYGIFNWSITGCLLLILVFAGSSRMAESISLKKYPLYKGYVVSLYKYLPIHTYKRNISNKK